jgi:hypothetical protein
MNQLILYNLLLNIVILFRGKFEQFYLDFGKKRISL